MDIWSFLPGILGAVDVVVRGAAVVRAEAVAVVLGAVAVALADAFAGAGLVVAPMKRDIKKTNNRFVF